MTYEIAYQPIDSTKIDGLDEESTRFIHYAIEHAFGQLPLVLTRSDAQKLEALSGAYKAWCFMKNKQKNSEPFQYFIGVLCHYGAVRVWIDNGLVPCE